MVTFIHDYTTVDGHTFRVAMITFTQRRVNSSKKHEIRLIAQKILAERIPQMTIDQFIQEITWSKCKIFQGRRIVSLEPTYLTK